MSPKQWIRALVGELRWTPPAWLAALLAPFARLRRRSPAAFAALLVFLLALGPAGYAGWRWWESRPKPEYLEVVVVEPDPTPLPSEELPDPLPNPLRLSFSGAAAPLEAIGKPVQQGLRLEPPLAGTWTWQSDSELEFQPAQDWPVGQRFELSFESGFFARQALLERLDYEFRSPRIAVEVGEPAFYEDPTDPLDKRVTATLRFTHPVDRASLEQHIALRLRVDPAQDFDAGSAEPVEFELSYDELGATAWLKSAAIALPEREGEVRVVVEAGVRAAVGGAGSEEESVFSVPIPSVESYFRVADVEASVATRDDHSMERILGLHFTAPVRVSDLSQHIALYELPKDKPAIGSQPAQRDHDWSNPSEVVPEVIALARRIEPDWLPSEPEYSRFQSLRYEARRGRWLYLRVAKGAPSFGDYRLAKNHHATVLVEPLPRTIEILHEGSLLSLGGDRKLSVLLRNQRDVEIELSRLLPTTLAQLVSQSGGDFQQPIFRGDLDTDDLSEIFREVRTLPKAAPGTPQYEVVDFTNLLSERGPPRGLFQLRVRGWDRKAKHAIDWPADRRLVLLTDLGLLVKDNADKTHELYVMSLRSGEPVEGAEVAILGRNGLPALSARTDAAGHATLPAFDDLEREKAPTVYVVRKGDDLAFLPYERRDRRLDLSRFDVGGLDDDAGAESLQAFVFSDRGIYRPGEEVRLGLVVKRLDWQALPERLPLELSVTDPRGIEIRRELLAFPAEGFVDWRFTPLETAPTGIYSAQLWIVRKGVRRSLLGQTTVRVEEFQPDRMTIDAQLSAPASKGWISPQELSARVALRNLFGTPAADRLIKASLRLSPTLPVFAGWEGWNFHDPLAAQNSYDETLAELRSDAAGEAVFPLGLERFERATYRLRFLAEGFEADGGRSVAMDAGAVVSPLPWLLAWRADGELEFVRKGAQRSVLLKAVGPDLAARDAAGLRAELLRIEYVSVLQRQPNGLYGYQSVRRETSLGTTPLEVAAAGTPLALPTDAVGSHAYVFRDAEGVELNRVAFEVVGEGNIAARFDRQAELELALPKRDFAPGEEIEVEIRAPYAGAGLITIERDKVYAAQWFRSATTASVQKIRLPEAVEGNAYVVVSFLRAIDSPEVFRSPLSSGAAAFSVSRARHEQKLELDVPDEVEPGAVVKLGYTLAQPARLAVFAVDEGILQVARWRTPDPLAHFFRKRALGVTTSQILDLLLPEFSLLSTQAAPGGDADMLLAGNLNPFKRRGLEPVAYWSGVIEAPAGAGAVEYALPDHFQGTLRVVAVAVDAAAVGVAEAKILVRGPFVLQPSVPYFVAPGDEFSVSTLVANLLEGSGKGAEVHVAIEVPEGLRVKGEAQQVLAIDEKRDAVARFELVAEGEPGPRDLVFRASAGARSTRSTLSLSLRPASPLRTTLGSVFAPKGGDVDLPLTRRLFGAHRSVEATASASPLGLALGLAGWLADYPHGCTEQVVSAAFPALALASQPDLAPDRERSAQLVERAFEILQARQDADGGFGVWSAGDATHAYIDVYALHFLLEARQRDFAVPAGLIERARARIEQQLQEPADTLPALREHAYAIYLLTREGEVETRALRRLAEELARVAPEAGERDVAALFLAASFRLLNLEEEALELARGVEITGEIEPDYESYHDALVHRALTLYLLSKHFPERARALSERELAAVFDEIHGNRFQTHSSALAVLALDAFAALSPPAEGAGITLAGLVDPKAAAQPLEASGVRLLRAAVPEPLRQVRASAPRGTPLYAQLWERGFDRTPPEGTLASGVEVRRELRNAAGEVVPRVPLGEKIDVVLTLRSTDGASHEIALVDLLPGGFEVDLTLPQLAERQSLRASDSEWQPRHVDVREDRIVFYGHVHGEASEFVYRIQPLHRGRYTLPPLQAEGLYDRRIEARSPGGSIEVVE